MAVVGGTDPWGVGEGELQKALVEWDPVVILLSDLGFGWYFIQIFPYITVVT